MNKLCLAALAVLALLAGCDTETTPVKSYPKTNPADVKIYDHAPGPAFESLGTVSYDYQYQAGGVHRADLGGNDPLGELRDQAAARGADAVIIKERDVYDTQNEGRRVRLSGLAIKFTPTPAPAAPTAPAMAPAGP